jgi:16S rRNA (guanine527-N7)-methyltransferase
MRPDRRHGRNSEPPTSIYPVDRPLTTGRNYVNGSQTKPQSDDDIAALRTELLAGGATLGVPLDDQAADRLLQFLELMRRWNGVYNLTAIRDPHSMLVQHLLDSLAVVPALRRQCGIWDNERPLRLLDVGSGGGLPGVVLAITCPALQIHCVDAVAKKAGFIRQAGAELGLPNLHSHHSRVEQLKLPAFDVVTSRAFASLADFVGWTRPLVARGGHWLAMKGVRPDAEIAALPAEVEVLHVEPIVVPGDPGERCIVWLRPVS